ncbi:glycosyltransferase family 31 [Lecanosticta acicola]|uniref:Glycosyltransferase family 31 n=1 Tax=Lecanosticta acicola TaxID=111012 RepID=A0AAI9E8E2_9PEZI|nr:glycosyltransferase family 31 [Lecanosticta acicola]
MPPVRLLQILAGTTLLLTFTYFLVRQPATDPRFPLASWQTYSPDFHNNGTLDIEVLRQIRDLPQEFDYQRYCVFAKENPALHRESVIRFSEEMLDEGASSDIRLDDGNIPNPEEQSVFPTCHSSFTLEVPEFSSHGQTSTKSLMLGVATTLKRIEESLPTFSRWLSNTGSPLVVLLVDQQNLDEKQEEINRVNTLASTLAIELIFEPYKSTYTHDSEGLKNFALATALDKHRRPETKWFGVIDDDTFFLSLPRMVENLAPFDPEKQWYIGALTEGHTRVSQEGFKAWGGAGFFISPPLMQILAENAVECTPLDRYFGDILWRDCIMEVTSPTVHLTEMKGLNQIDMWKDISGWYEAGFNPILTVHHWKSWHFFPIAISHIVTDVAGPDALLQRYQFGNHTVFTNGYSIVQYPRGVPDLNLVELTMTEDVNVKRPPEPLEFHHSMGKTRPALEYGKEKISWLFEHAVKTADNTVRQFYVKRTTRDPDGPVESIIEVDWRHA